MDPDKQAEKQNWFHREYFWESASELQEEIT